MPARRLSAAILCNSDQTDTSVLGTKLLGALVAASPEDIAATFAAAHASDAPRLAPTGSANLRIVGEMIGVYAGEDSETVFTARVTGGKLELTDDMGNRSLLEPVGADAFRIPGTPWVLIFTRNEAGQITGFGASTPSTRNLRFDRRAAPVQRP